MTSPRHKERQLSKVNQSPRGLQSLLGNVNQGMNPDELDNIVKGGVDLLPFWGVDKLDYEIKSNANLPPTPGAGVQVTVPEGEVWMPVNVTAYLTVRIGDIMTVGLRLRHPSGNLWNLDIVRTKDSAAVAGEQLWCGGKWNADLLIPAGYAFKAEVDASEVQTGTTFIACRVLYYKFQL